MGRSDATNPWVTAAIVMCILWTCPRDGQTQLFRRATGRLSPSQAAPLIQRLTASDAEQADSFGWSVAISGDTLAVCAVQADDPDAPNAGSVYLFTRSDGVWNELQIIPSPNPQHNGYFGQVLALSDNHLFVGFPTDTIDGVSRAGSVFVYTKNGDTYSQTQHLFLDVPLEAAHFGTSLSTDGETLLIGAPRADENQKGLVFILERDDTSWYHTQTLAPDDRMSDDNFGAASALDGDWLVVGAPGGFNGPIWGAGEVYVFRRQGDTWIEHQKLTPTDPDWYDGFGGPVAISGGTMLISALGKDHGSSENAGAVYVFTENSGHWSHGVQLFGPNPADGTAWGGALALSGDTAMVGFANTQYSDPVFAGAVDILTRANDAWSYGPRLVSPQAVSSGAFGYSLALSGSDLLIGAPVEDAPGPVWDAGAAYVVSIETGISAHTMEYDGAPHISGD